MCVCMSLCVCVCVCVHMCVYNLKISCIIPQNQLPACIYHLVMIPSLLYSLHNQPKQKSALSFRWNCLRNKQ